MTFDVSPHPPGEGPCRAGDSQPRPPRVTGTSFCLSRCSSFPDGSFTGSQHTPLRMESIKSQQRQLPCDISPERINSSSRSSEWFSLDSPSSRDLGAEFPAPPSVGQYCRTGGTSHGVTVPKVSPTPRASSGSPWAGGAAGAQLCSRAQSRTDQPGIFNIPSVTAPQPLAGLSHSKVCHLCPVQLCRVPTPATCCD